MQVSKLGVVGCGEVGVGLIARAVSCGVEVVAARARGGSDPGAVRDAVARALARGPRRHGVVVGARSARRAAMTPAAHEAAMARVHVAPALDSVALCDLALEACHEDLADKRAVLAAIESHLLPRAILVSHSRALAPAALAEGLLRPCRFVVARVLGGPLGARAVELATTERTRAAVLAATRDFFEQLALTGRHVGDEPADAPAPRGYVAAVIAAPPRTPSSPPPAAPAPERESVF